MSRLSLRLLGATTAVAVAVALAPGLPSASAAEPPTPKPATAAAPDGITIGDTAVSSTSFTTLTAKPAARPATWPIGGGAANLTVHPDPPTGAPAQQRFARVQMWHYRAYGGVTRAVVDMAAAPTPATRTAILLAFGRISGTQCVSAAGHNYNFSSTDVDNQNNPVYSGRRITVRPFRFAAARTATWNCAFAQSVRISDGVKLDSVAGGSSLFRQTPLLSIRVKGRTLKRRGYTKVPVIIRNSPATIATAPNVRISWKAKGVRVRGKKKVGTIRPGTGKRGAIYVKDVRRGNGKIKLTVKSRTYSRSLTVTVRERRR